MTLKVVERGPERRNFTFDALPSRQGQAETESLVAARA